MDSSVTVKPRVGPQKAYAPRDPVPVREATETDLNAARAVAATGDAGRHGQHHGQQGHHGHGHHEEPHHEHAPHEVTVDPQSRAVIYREQDVRAADREHPDQALQRQRAYGRQAAQPDTPPADDPHADIKA
jgi:hypothetical protein